MGPPWNKLAHSEFYVYISQTLIVHKHGEKYRKENDTTKKAISGVPRSCISFDLSNSAFSDEPHGKLH